MYQNIHVHVHVHPINTQCSPGEEDVLAGEEGESVGLLLTLSLAVQDAVLSERQVIFAPFMPAHPPGDQQVITDCMLLLSTYAQGTMGTV